MSNATMRYRTIIVAVITTAILWIATATWGVWDVIRMADRSAASLNQSLGPLQLIDFDPDVGSSEKQMPWYFIGNASAPLPLIVAIDYAHQVGPTAGQRSRVYCLWFFGLKLPVYERVDWMS